MARWTSIDPLAESIPAYSPYSYTFGNPISYNDPTGMMGESISTNVVNEKTNESIFINDGYYFTFVVSDEEFQEIKSSNSIKGTKSYGR